MWELSWYRYEVDLSDEAGGVRRDAQGDELSELSAEEQVANAAADDRGGLHLSKGQILQSSSGRVDGGLQDRPRNSTDGRMPSGGSSG